MNDSTPKLISVVIPTRDRNETLARCLDRLAPCAQSLSHDLYEVVVSDDSAHAADWRLSPADLDRIEEIMRGAAGNLVAT